MRGLKKIRTVRARLAMLMCSLFALPAAAQPQPMEPPEDSMAARLSAERIAEIEPGSYSAGDQYGFSLESFGSRYLLRLDGNPEIFALAVDRVAPGGRVLKYDTGATALRVSAWGGVTLYTETAPGGLPATRTGDFIAAPRLPVSASDLQTALRDEGEHLAYTQHVTLHFAAPVGGEAERTAVFDLLANIDAGIERLLANPAGRAALAKRVQTVKLAQAAKPGLSLSGRTLTVTFASSLGPAGRPSSRAISVALGKILAVPEAD
jgi:hypothetical protein